MRINLLSEVTVRNGGNDGNGGADLLADLQPMHRLFVAVLALEAGQPVGMDRLEERLWGDFLPAEPRARLHTCKSRVCAALRPDRNGGAGDDLVVAQPGGYCLRMDRQCVDVHRFREKAAKVRALPDGDDRVAALAREALLEWGRAPARLHGPEPLAGLPGQWAANYRLTLRREHRDVLIQLLGAQIRQGGGAESVLAEFASLADADEAAREDEQLTALLMRAYYLCGRQSEAMRTYQRTVESLRRKGVEAGRELRMLERKIRNQDPSLDYPSEFVIESHDLVRAGGGHSDEQGGKDTSAPVAGDAGAAEPEDPGVGPGSSTKGGPVYSQRNIGRTVIANQGTQHVNLGGSDE